MSKLNQKINKIDKNSQLYYLYKNLLTQKQQQVFELYYNEDFSLIEISIKLQISKNAVYDSLNKTDKILEDFENKLNLNKKILKLEKLLDQLNQEILDDGVKIKIKKIKNVF